MPAPILRVFFFDRLPSGFDRSSRRPHFVRSRSAPQPAEPAPAAAAPKPAPAKKGPYRALAPGVEITIPPDRQEDDTFSSHDLIEILSGIPESEVDPQDRAGHGDAPRHGHRHRVPPQHLVPGIHLPAGADDLGRRAATHRQDAAEADLVHGLSRQEPRAALQAGAQARRHVRNSAGRSCP